MSQENVEIVRRAFEYKKFGVGGRAEAEAIFDPDVVMASIDEAPKYGPEAMRDDFEQWASAWEELEVTLEEIIDAGGDRVVALLSASVRGKASGVPLDNQRFAIVFTFEGQRIARADSYLSPAEALEAAGLS